MSTTTSRTTDPVCASEIVKCDVAILGGGIAGLTLARQLYQADPTLRIEVIERSEHPAPTSAHKVGESSVEVQAHYLREVLGLAEHLEKKHVRKFGLRMFMTYRDNSAIEHRVEYGQISHAPLPAYQLDRGILETHLGQELRNAGVSFRTGHRVTDVALCRDLAAEPSGSSQRDGRHKVTVVGEGRTLVFAARWVVDASGRAGLLKRRLGLAKSVDHHANASWLRIDHSVDVESWSDDHNWLSRLDCGQRRLSTNHLMGPGYWVWIIPLSSGATSVGIVAADEEHDHSGFNTLSKALDWLDEHEPQLAADLRAHQDKVLDFRIMNDYSYSSTEVYNSNRWALTGEAGVSVDPLYSSGGDLMAISNSLITDLIVRDHAGQDVADVAVSHNQLYLLFSEIWLVAYSNQYAVLGNAQVAVAKIIWDTIVYWAVPGLLYFQNKLPSVVDSPILLTNLYRTWEIHTLVQNFFITWHNVDNPAAGDVFADPYTLMDFLIELHTGMADDLDDDAFMERISQNVALLEQIAGQLFHEVCMRLENTNADQVEAWRASPEISSMISRYRELNASNPIDPSWIRLGIHDPAEMTAKDRDPYEEQMHEAAPTQRSTVVWRTHGEVAR